MLDRRSTIGYVFKFQGTPISWISKNQPIVARICSIACQAAWIEVLLIELRVNIQLPIKLLFDNKYAINLLKNHVSHGRSKHIEIRFHYVREKVNKERLAMKHCPTKDQIVDILNKAVKGEQFSKLKIDM